MWLKEKIQGGTLKNVTMLFTPDQLQTPFLPSFAIVWSYRKSDEEVLALSSSQASFPSHRATQFRLPPQVYVARTRIRQPIFIGPSSKRRHNPLRP